MILMRPVLMLSCLLFVQPAPAAGDTLVVKPIAVQRGTAPEGGRYVIFGDASIDNTRRVTFTASLSRGQTGLFRTRRNGVEKILLTGDAAPSDAGNNFHFLDEGASNTTGDLAFIANVFSPPAQGIFLLHDGVVSTIALTGRPAPTAGGEFFDTFDQIFLLESGDIYFGAWLRGPPSSPVPAGRAIIRAGPGGLRPVIAPGDLYGGTRMITAALQFDVNESGDVTALAAETDADQLQQQEILEIVHLTGGRLSTLASVNLSATPAGDLVRNLAITFDQVHVDDDGTSSFFAGTTTFPLGAIYENTLGKLFANHRILAQGDATPFALPDRISALGAFGLNRSGTIVYHSLTTGNPGGTLSVMRDGMHQSVALTGQTRPDGTDVWHGFSRIDLNEQDEFVFTDFEGQFANVGVFMGRFIPPVDTLLKQLEDLAASGELDPGLTGNLKGFIQAIRRALARDDQSTAIRLIGALGLEIDRRTGRSIPPEVAAELSRIIEDLVYLLGPPPAGGPGGPQPRRRGPMQR